MSNLPYNVEFIHKTHILNLEIEQENDVLLVKLVPEMDQYAFKKVNLVASLYNGQKCLDKIEHIYNHDDEHPIVEIPLINKLGIKIGRLDYTLNMEDMVKSIFYNTKTDNYEIQRTYIEQLEQQLKERQLDLNKLDKLDNQALDQVMTKIISIKQERKTCSICKEEEVKYACIPCGHCCMCSGCHDIYDTESGCPMCRQIIETTIVIYQ